MRKLLFAVSLLMLVSCSETFRVACVGDSITEGAGINNQTKSTYPVQLDSILGDNYRVLNCGKGGTTLQKRGDYSYWNTKEFSNVFAYNPNIVIVKLGTNDTKPQNWNSNQFKLDYQSLIDTLRTLPAKPEILLCIPVPVFNTEWGINDSTLIDGVIPIVKQLAQLNNLKLIDLNTPMLQEKVCFPDNIHPNEVGARLMAQIIALQMQKK